MFWLPYGKFGNAAVTGSTSMRVTPKERNHRSVSRFVVQWIKATAYRAELVWTPT